MAKKDCVICGKEGYGYYPFCYQHLQQKNKGDIVKCDDCDSWYIELKGCSCQEAKKQQEIEALDLTVSKKCLTCNNEANGEHAFCKSCYFKYKNKAVLLKIRYCKEVEFINAAYDNMYTCKDGHIVKSKSERAIDQYLYEKKVCHAYEQVLEIDNNPKNDLRPDFYLPQYDAYLEHWGYGKDNKDYTAKKAYKLAIYKDLGLTIICTNENDIQDINTSLRHKLANFEKGKINFDID